MEPVKEDKSKYLSTNLGIYRLGRSDWSVRTTCSMSTKYEGSIEAYIPVEWCEAFGHTLETVQEWVDFVNKALTRTHPAELINSKTEDFIHQFPNKEYKTSVIQPRGYASRTGTYDPQAKWTDEEKKKCHSGILEDKFYHVHIPSGTRYENYGTFVLLRHLWCHSYVPLLKLVLEIRDNLKITNNKELTAIMMAYATSNYDGYYGLLENSYKWYYRYVNPVFNKQTDSLNYAFELFNFNIRHPTDPKLLKPEQVQALTLLVEARNWEALEHTLFERELFVFKKEEPKPKPVPVEKVEINVPTGSSLDELYQMMYETSPQQVSGTVIGNGVSVDTGRSGYFTSGSMRVVANAPEHSYKRPYTKKNQAYWNQRTKNK